MIDAGTVANDAVLLATLRLLNVCRSCPLDESDGTYRGDQMLWHELWWALEDHYGGDLHDVLNDLERSGLV
jgi:hypothetical protein